MKQLIEAVLTDETMRDQSQLKALAAKNANFVPWNFLT